MKLIITFIALGLSGTAGYMSIAGLMALFSGHAVATGIMAAFLELGKLAMAHLTHKRWDSMKTPARVGMMSIVGVLMLVTSCGVYSFLMQGSLPGIGSIAASSKAIEALRAEEKILSRVINRMDREMEALPINYVTARVRVRDSGEYGKLIGRLVEIRGTFALYEQEAATVAVHAGPIFAISDQLGIDHRLAISFFILALVLVFDPMGVILVIISGTLWKESRDASPEGKRATLESIMLNSGMNQKEAASIAGVKAYTVSSWLSGKREIPAGRLLKLADLAPGGVA